MTQGELHRDVHRDGRRRQRRDADHHLRRPARSGHHGLRHHQRQQPLQPHVDLGRRRQPRLLQGSTTAGAAASGPRPRSRATSATARPSRSTTRPAPSAWSR
ncbi:hypothetical protein G5V59_02920 [Nocardioides sp. W3-2-3]|uniref:hypothetical protein n=1 Tax=Nocardioides convexus TaxID=2712224 RepID=UPI0024186CEF|nr:hypothetical protein [Nocardioides convexus]NGZ99692.1 hypothetical protein [Nocardioides convexus]